MKNKSEGAGWGTKLFLFLYLLGYNYLVSGQITGVVYNAQTNKPLPGLTIICGNKATKTNFKGFFKLDTLGLIKIKASGYQEYSRNFNKKVEAVSIFLKPLHQKIDEVIIKGPLRESQLLSIPASVSILENDALEQASGISYLEKLNQLSGVFIHNGTLNTNRVVIRGMGSRTPYGTNRVKAFYNGIPLTSADGTTNIEDIDGSLLNSVEVLKGPKSAVYGAGLGGIIILTSKEQKEDGLQGTFSAEAGSFNSFKPLISLSFKKDWLSVNAFYAYTKNDGFRENSSYTRHSGQVQISRTSENNITQLLIHFIDLKAYIPSSINEEVFNNNPESAASNWLNVKGFEEYTKVIGSLTNTYSFNSQLKNKLILYNNFADAFESRPFNILSDKNNRIGLKNYLDYSSNNLQLRLGFELVKERYDWDIFETNDGIKGTMLNSFSEDRNYSAIFADFKWESKNKKFVIESGLSYNFQSYQLKDLQPVQEDLSGNFDYEPIAAPFIGISSRLFKKLRFYGSYSYGFSYPSVEETLLPDGQINSDLKPETGHCFEAGFRYSAFDGNLFVDAGSYYLVVDNLLLTERITEDIFTGKNAGSTTHKGLEISSSLLLNKNEANNLPSVKISLSFTSSENLFDNFTDDGIDYKGKILPGIPKYDLSGSLKLSYEKGFYLNSSVRATGKQFLDDANSNSYDSYTLADLKVGYKINIKQTKFNVYFGINNLFNAKYASMILVNAPSFGGNLPRYYYPGQPRYFYGGLAVSF